MPGKKRKLSLVEILVIVSILLILMSIMGGGRKKSRRMSAGSPGARPAAQAPSSYPTSKPGEGDKYFWRP